MNANTLQTIALVAHGNLYLTDPQRVASFPFDLFRFPFEFWWGEEKGFITKEPLDWFRYLREKGARRLFMVKYFERKEIPGGASVVDTFLVEVKYPDSIQRWRHFSYYENGESAGERLKRVVDMIQRGEDVSQLASSPFTKFTLEGRRSSTSLKKEIPSLQSLKDQLMHVAREIERLKGGFYRPGSLALQVERTDLREEDPSLRYLPKMGYPLEAHCLLNAALRLTDLFHKESIIEEYYSKFSEILEAALTGAVNSFDPKLV